MHSIIIGFLLFTNLITYFFYKRRNKYLEKRIDYLYDNIETGIWIIDHYKSENEKLKAKYEPESL